jgi:hypothetical protein
MSLTGYNYGQHGYYFMYNVYSVVQYDYTYVELDSVSFAIRIHPLDYGLSGLRIMIGIR